MAGGYLKTDEGSVKDLGVDIPEEKIICFESLVELIIYPIGIGQVI
jgi:hypothetical protein